MNATKTLPICGFSRHLIRLWLRNDELAWKTPEPLQPNWRRLYSVGPDQQRFPLEPEVRKKDNNPIPPPPVATSVN